MKYVAATLLATAVGPFAAPGHAHHSASLYDEAHTVVLNGTIREFQWTNPRCWIQLDVPSADGSDESSL
jgi:hypothetical protein